VDFPTPPLPVTISRRLSSTAVTGYASPSQ